MSQRAVRPTSSALPARDPDQLYPREPGAAGIQFRRELPNCEGPMENTVLVVDDDDDVRTELSEALLDEGFQVALAGDGAHALRLLGEGVRPALILLDLMMPTMNGWEFVAEQAAHPELGGAPIVLMSGSRLPPGTTIPDGDFLPKPIRLDALLAIVRRWCRPQARAAAQKL